MQMPDLFDAKQKILCDQNECLDPELPGLYRQQRMDASYSKIIILQQTDIAECDVSLVLCVPGGG